MTRCRVVKPHSGEACGAPAVYLVTFKDGLEPIGWTSAPACLACKLALQLTAQACGTSIGARKLEPEKLEKEKEKKP